MKRLDLRILLVFPLALCFLTGYNQTVYVTPTGETYHTKSHDDSGSPISLADAQKKGYEPCSVCKPTTKATQSIYNNTGDTKKNATASQCHGITKAGTRCKRTTTNANGYCYQHQKN